MSNEERVQKINVGFQRAVDLEYFLNCLELGRYWNMIDNEGIRDFVVRMKKL